MKYFILFTALTLGYFNYAQNWHPSTDPNWEIVFEDDFTTTSGTINVDTNKWYSSYPWNQSRHGAIVTKNIADTLLPPEIAYVTRNYENIVKPSPTTIGIHAKKEDQLYRGVAWDWTNCENCLADFYNYEDSTNLPYLNNLDTIYISVDSNLNVTNYYKFYNGSGILDSLFICDMKIKQGDTSYSCFKELYFDYTHTMGTLTSTKHFKYGFYELKFRVPQGGQPHSTYSGSSWWLYELDESTKIESELDFFEINGHKNNYFASNIHYLQHDEDKDTALYAYHGLTDNEVIRMERAVDTNWHKATCLWTKDKITTWIDGNFVAEFQKHSSDLDPMYMIINTSYPANNYSHTDITLVPDNYLFEIDYVKVYQLKKDCNTAINHCNLPINPIEGIQKSIKVGGNNCNYTLNPHGQNSYYAKDFIFLDKGFESQLGTVFEGYIEECPSITPRSNLPIEGVDYYKTMLSIGQNKQNNALNTP